MPTSLKNVISAKKVRYVTGSSESSYVLNDDITDKIWAFSHREVYGTQDYAGGITEGLGNNGHGYSKFSSTDSKDYVSPYYDSAFLQRVCFNEANNSSGWWLRSPNLYSTYCTCCVECDSQALYGNPYDDYGLTFGFCIN